MKLQTGARRDAQLSSRCCSTSRSLAMRRLVELERMSLRRSSRSRPWAPLVLTSAIAATGPRGFGARVRWVWSDFRVCRS